MKNIMLWLSPLLVLHLFIAGLQYVAAKPAYKNSQELFAEDPTDEKEVKKIRLQKLKRWEAQLKSITWPVKNKNTLFSLTSQILNEDSKNLLALSSLGTYYMQKGQHQMAKFVFNQALKAHPKGSFLHNSMGLIFLKEGKKNKALSSFRKVFLI